MREAMLILALVVVLGALGPGAGAGEAVQKVTLTMRDFSYTPAKVTLQAGVPMEIIIVNRGKVTHEFMLHKRPMGGMPPHDWAEDNSYFKGLKVAVEGSGIEVERKRGNLVEVRIGAGKTAVLRFTPVRKGTFEYACFIQGHYEQGMKGLITIQ